MMKTNESFSNIIIVSLHDKENNKDAFYYTYWVTIIYERKLQRSC